MLKKNIPAKNIISERIDKLLKQRGITAYELCKNTGYNEGKLHMARRRVNSFGSSKMLYDFAKYLHTTADYLISGKDTAADQDELIRSLISELDSCKKEYTALKSKINKIKSELFVTKE